MPGGKHSLALRFQLRVERVIERQSKLHRRVIVGADAAQPATDEVSPAAAGSNSTSCTVSASSTMRAMRARIGSLMS